MGLRENVAVRTGHFPDLEVSIHDAAPPEARVGSSVPEPSQSRCPEEDGSSDVAFRHVMAEGAQARLGDVGGSRRNHGFHQAVPSPPNLAPDTAAETAHAREAVAKPLAWRKPGQV